mmetsp:Transcript_35992/g.61397  ORF Transcript_35992/g.61397 Transcript_35992/m.61397 type:complete len:114 (-) Transcript_35992:1398-1739(-)
MHAGAFPVMHPKGDHEFPQCQVGPTITYWRHVRVEGLPLVHEPEQQSGPLLHASPNLAKGQTTGLPVGAGVGFLVGDPVVGGDVGAFVGGGVGGVGAFVGRGVGEFVGAADPP